MANENISVIGRFIHILKGMSESVFKRARQFIIIPSFLSMPNIALNAPA